MATENHSIPKGDIIFNKNYKAVECPKCSNLVIAAVTEGKHRCNKCGAVFTLLEKAGHSEYVSPKAAEIKTVSAAKTYMDYLFERYDWYSFARDFDKLSIAEADVIIQNLKIYQPNDKETWKLSFFYKYRCIFNKISYIHKTIEYLVQRFSCGTDIFYCRNKYNNLKLNYELMLEKKNDIIDELYTCITYFKKLQGSNEEFFTMNTWIEQLRNQFDTYVLYPDFDSYPAVEHMIETRDKALRESYAKLGIDAENIYREGVNAFNGGDYSTATYYLGRILKYKDAADYVNKMGTIKLLNGCFCLLHGEAYYFKGKLHPAKSKLIDSEQPITDGFDFAIGCYGDKFYYFDKTVLSQINYIDLNSPINKSGLPDVNIINLYDKPELSEQLNVINGVFNPTNEYYDEAFLNGSHKRASSDKLYFLIKHDETNPRSKEEKQSFLSRYKISREKSCKKWLIQCYDKIFESNKVDFATYKKQFAKTNLFANQDACYDLVEVNTLTDKAELLLENIVDVQTFKDGNIYFVAPMPHVVGKNLVYDRDALYSFNVRSREMNFVLEGHCKVEYLFDESTVIVTRKNADFAAADICLVNHVKNEEKVLVKNVYKYLTCMRDKILYLTGNSRMSALNCISVNGSGCVELVKRLQSVAFVRDDYVYYVCGDPRTNYKTLFRISVSNAKPQRVAFGIHKNDVTDSNRVLDDNGYLYYVNYNRQLCKVRLDGAHASVLTDKAERIIKITKHKIYFTGIETVEGERLVSLYSMESDGNAKQKIVYNVKDVDVKDDKTLVFTKIATLKSKELLYTEVDNPKLLKKIKYTYNSIYEAGKQVNSSFLTLYSYDLATSTSNELLYGAAYPTNFLLNKEFDRAFDKNKA